MSRGPDTDAVSQVGAMAPALDAIMGASPVISVVTLDELSDAEALAEILVEEGLPSIEVTLRTPIALVAIKAMSHVEGAMIGAGTVLSAVDVAQAVAAGAKFLVSPGLSERTVLAAAENGIPILPGVATASEIMRGMELGLSRFKFFPAEAAGGAASLRAFHGPFPDFRFCPTGGLTRDNALAYLALPNVACVGGSWIAPRGRLDKGAVRAAAAATRAALARGAGG